MGREISEIRLDCVDVTCPLPLPPSARIHLACRRFTAALTLAVAACGGAHDKASPARSGARPAPSYVAHTLAGDTVALASLRGKVVVLNVWATWCEPCREEIPQLEALHRAYADSGLVMVGVSVDDAGSAGDVRSFARDHGVTYALWLDPDKRFAMQFLTVGVPETFLVDRDGVIGFRKIGALAHGDTSLAAAIRAALVR